MSRDLQEGPTAAEIQERAATQRYDARQRTIAEFQALDAEYYKEHRNTAKPAPIPTIAVFIEGGLIQDICFDGAVRVVVIDFDQENDDPDDDKMGDYTTPDGDVVRVGVGLWQRINAEGSDNWSNDRATVRAALRAAGEV